MTEQHSETSCLKVVTVGKDGKRRFDRRTKQRLVEACLEPGASVAGLALRRGVNANLLHKWIKLHQQRLAVASRQSPTAEPAFVPVVRASSEQALVELERESAMCSSPETTASIATPSISARASAAKSEVRGPEQRDLFLNEAEALATGCEPAQETEVEPSIEVGAHERKKRGRKPLDPMLPREIVRHELPESERVCAHDGHALVEIGADISEQLDIVPQQVRVIQHQRIKYACPCCNLGIKVTPAPARIIPKGLLTESALAWVVVSKFADALPLYRIAALLHRFGGDLSRGTLAASVGRVGTAVQPLVQVLKEPGRAAQRKSYMWAQMSRVDAPDDLMHPGALDLA